MLLDSLTRFVRYTSASVLLLERRFAARDRRAPRLRASATRAQRLGPRRRGAPASARAARRSSRGRRSSCRRHRARSRRRAAARRRRRAELDRRPAARGRSGDRPLRRSRARRPARSAEDDVDWAEALTAQAAAAIENARLHDQLQRHAAELEQRVAERTQDLDARQGGGGAREPGEERVPRRDQPRAAHADERDPRLRPAARAGRAWTASRATTCGQILRAGRHLLELITELLDIARIEAGELALSLEPVSVERPARRGGRPDPPARRAARA